MNKTFYWIKLYHEIITDPKMGQLDDHTWRRAIEFFLIAGDYNQAGRLPPISHLVWTLRTSEEDIKSALIVLEKVKIIHRDQDALIITNFAERQGALSTAERSRRYRQRHETSRPTSRNRHAPVTTRVTKSDAHRHDRATKSATDTDKDKDRDKEREEDVTPPLYHSKSPKNSGTLAKLQREIEHGN